MRLTLLIFSDVLLGASAGILALIARGLTFSITGGFITLFGVSVLNGVVLVSEINRLREIGSTADDAIAQALRDRLRPIHAGQELYTLSRMGEGGGVGP